VYLKYGSYQHADNEAAVRMSKRPLLSDSGTRIGFTETWSIRGILQADTTSALVTATASLDAAYAVNGYDLVLYDGSGNAVRSLISSSTMGGVVITQGPDYPEGEGAEWANKRVYEITAEAEVLTSGVSNLVSYSETLSFSGGGPLRVYLTTLRGLPQLQETARYTPYVVRQSGNAVGLFARPAPADPLFPGALIRSPEITEQTPEFKAGQYKNFGISWSYEFQSASPLVGHSRLPS